MAALGVDGLVNACSADFSLSKYSWDSITLSILGNDEAAA